MMIDALEDIPDIKEKAVALARKIQKRADELTSKKEAKQLRELKRLVESPDDKAILMRLIDESFRPLEANRTIDQIRHILNTQGVPGFLSYLDRTLLKGFVVFGPMLPRLAVNLFKKYMRRYSRRTVLPAEEIQLKRHLRKRYAEKIRVNINRLGEAVLSEAEAESRLHEYVSALQDPDIEVVSVKISSIYSQIQSIAASHSIGEISRKLKLLYAAAKENRYFRLDGSAIPKFVYLDMENYADLYLTSRAFMEALSQPDMIDVSAGIALQAYIPDSISIQASINQWAKQRVASGGAPITIRLVKGANLEMERVEASIRQWPQAPYLEKVYADAGFKRMLHTGLKPENAKAVSIGIASHNLFDVALGFIWAKENNVLNRVQFEMLEGMAPHIQQALMEITSNVLLYTPITKKEDFISSIRYLVRRLDENTGKENFLRHLFRLDTDSDVWNRLEQQFLDSYHLMDTVSDKPQRTQDRNLPVDEKEVNQRLSINFVNEPDTDFSLPQNQQWAASIIDKWKPLYGDNAKDIPLVVAGEDIYDERAVHPCRDPSRPGAVVGRYREATQNDIDRAIDCAVQDKDGWRKLAVDIRAEQLSRVAMEIRNARGNLMGAAIADGGKLLLESDPEVSEAIDFLEYYSRSATFFHQMEHINCRGRGLIVVISPWNFPIAIPCGGIAAALAAGNTVIFKPASDAVLVAYELCQCFWRAGISKRALQFLPCAGSTTGYHLVTHRKISGTILTGGTDTAAGLLAKKPTLDLYAETGGKNATIVTAMADREQAIENVLHSAFSHSGQKCSATSLLVLEKSIFNDTKFKRQLKEAAQSLSVGSAWELNHKIGPLIRPPKGGLHQAIHQLDANETWLLEPKNLENNPNLWSPGIKWSVKPGSFMHMTELFGPVLSVLCAENLEEAIQIVNMTGYGLTAGLESLDDREHKIWKDRIYAGNLYINRRTTGAIVLRQPFGGLGKSCFGPGIKAGGPNYVSLFMDRFEKEVPENDTIPSQPFLKKLWIELKKRKDGLAAGIPDHDVRKIIWGIQSCTLAHRDEFSKEHDEFKLRGQDNLRRYLPIKSLIIRVTPSDTIPEIFLRVIAATTAGIDFYISVPDRSDIPGVVMLKQMASMWNWPLTFVEQSDKSLMDLIRDGKFDRIRYAAPDRVPEEILEAASTVPGVYIAKQPVLAEGWLELLWYYREQSVSHTYHRYGNLGNRAPGNKGVEE